MSGAYLYSVRCIDGSYYVGTARDGLERRISEHNDGTFGGYTSTRRPVQLVFAEHFETITDAIAVEQQIKGWSRAKKEALIAGDWGQVSALARRRGLILRDALLRSAPQDEDKGWLRQVPHDKDEC